MIYLIFCTSVICLSFLLTAGLRRYALAKSIIDIPNARSSHSLPTPRGGGVAIVVAFALAVLLLVWAHFLPWRDALGLLGPGLAVALIGFMDDHGHIAARWRLLGHFSASCAALVCLGGLPAIQFGEQVISLGWLGLVLAAFYLVWILNLYNFMDGIDGIASVEAVSVCLGGSALYLLAGKSDLAITPLVLALSVSGFLLWNFPPAKIFMGDAGSGFLGMVLGVLSLQAGWVSSELLWGWLILLGVFIVDATFTLLRRLCRGEKVYEAHRSHAYQFASRKHGAHRPVTLTVLAINILWLLPISVAVVGLHWNGFFSLLFAYIPLVVIAAVYHAGQPERSA